MLSVGERRLILPLVVVVVEVEVVKPAVPSTTMGNVCGEPSDARVGWMS